MSMSPSEARTTGLIVLLGALTIGSGLAYAQPSTLEKQSEQGLFVVSLESQLSPIPINRMHSWQVTLKDPENQRVLGAQITITGGMPQHDHGLPTAPRMTRRLEDGQYLVEGMKFHMNGMWQLTLVIQSGGRSDTVTFDIKV